jgi:hypothetical protein
LKGGKEGKERREEWRKVGGRNLVIDWQMAKLRPCAVIKYTFLPLWQTFPRLQDSFLI